ncbi:hypothetical protein ACFL5O_09435 [Myxococcota bacterium]
MLASSDCVMGVPDGQCGSVAVSTEIGWMHKSRRMMMAIAMAVLCGCGAANFDGRMYRGAGFAFRVGAVPAAWRAVAVEQTLLAFRDDERRATVAVSGRCGQDGDDVPLDALTRHLFLHFTNRNLTSKSAFKLDGREALRTEVQAQLDGVPKHFTVVVLKKDECVYDFVCIEDGAGSEVGRSHFDRFVMGFATLG